MTVKRILIIVFILLILSGESIAEGQWKKIENQYFDILYPTSEEKIAQTTFDILMKYRRNINVQLDYYENEKMTVIICDSDECFRKKTRGGVPDWGVGCAYPQKKLIILKVPRIAGKRLFSYKQTVLHEYTHIVLGQVLEDTFIPEWFHEGVAMYQAGQFGFGDKAKIGWASLSGNLIPLSSLDLGFPYYASKARLAYLQSLTTIEFIMDEWGEKGLSKLIKVTNEVDNFDIAIKLAFGISRARFEDKWKSYVTRRYNWGIIFSNPFFWWIAITILFLIGYWRKRRKSKKVLDRWEEEESEMYGEAY